MLDPKTDNDIRLKAMRRIFKMVSPYDKNNKVIYAVGGGAAVYLVGNKNRPISDIDLVYNSFKDPDALYKRLRKATESEPSVQSLHIDLVSLNRDIYGAFVIDNMTFEKMLLHVDYCGIKVPVLRPEAIIASKIGSKYVSNDILRDKDVEDVFMLKNDRLEFEKLKEYFGYIPKTILPKNYDALDLVVSKTFSLYNDDPELAKRVLKNCRKVAKNIEGSPSKISDYHDIVKYFTENDEKHIRSVLG